MAHYYYTINSAIIFNQKSKFISKINTPSSCGNTYAFHSHVNLYYSKTASYGSFKTGQICLSEDSLCSCIHKQTPSPLIKPADRSTQLRLELREEQFRQEHLSCRGAIRLSRTDTKKRIISGKACCVCLHMCLSAGCGLVGVKDSVCQQHSTPYHQCVIIPLQALSACSVIFPLSGIASASICSFTNHAFYIWMERRITTAAGLVGEKSTSQAPTGNRYTYCGCAALCCAIW